MRKIALLTLLTLIVTNTALANSLEIESEQPLLVSYVNHPTIKHQYLPLVKAMYKQANIPIKLTEVSNSQRTIVGVNNGLFDADIGKVLEVIKDFPEITYIPTPLSNTTLYLICNPDIDCNNELVLQDNSTLVAPYSKKTLSQVLKIKAKIHKVNSKNAAIKMLESKRTQYILIGDDADISPIKGKHHYTILKLASSHLYHIINKKHQRLIPKLDHALKNLLSQQRLLDGAL